MVYALGFLVLALLLVVAALRCELRDLSLKVRIIDDANDRLSDKLDELDGKFSSDDEEEDADDFVATHVVTSDGTEIEVRKSKPGYGVDCDGDTWPLFIEPGQKNYVVRRI